MTWATILAEELVMVKGSDEITEFKVRAEGNRPQHLHFLNFVNSTASVLLKADTQLGRHEPR